MTTLHDFKGVLGRPLDAFIWALTINGHGSWVVCEAAIRDINKPHIRIIESSLTSWSMRLKATLAYPTIKRK